MICDEVEVLLDSGFISAVGKSSLFEIPVDDIGEEKFF